MTMKRFALLTLLLGLVASAAFAQGRGGIRHYDPKTETTVKGTITEVQQPASMRGGSTGVHLFLKTDTGDLEVHASPSSYVSQKQFSFTKGEAIEVVGSKVTIAGKEVILAREITKDGKTLVLRNAQGVPQWSGGRRDNN
jgi:DNA/RNA endonuclease YhcR with UshA esterase domain